MKRNINKFCAATTIAAVLLSASPLATPVVHAGWGSVIGGVIGGILNGGGSGGSSGGGNGGGSLGGLSNQQHAHPHPNDNEKLFILAVENNDIGSVSDMLNAGVDINGVYPGITRSNHGAMDYQGRTALIIAISNNYRDMMQVLLENGADIAGFYSYDNMHISYLEYVMNMHTVLGDASVIIDLAQFLLDWGADINGTSDYSGGRKFYPMDSYPSSINDVYENADCVRAQFLLEHGAYMENKGPDGNTPFLRAVSYKFVKLMNLLADNGANINAKDKKGRNALQIALDSRDLQFYKEVQDIMARGQQPSQYQPSQPQTQRHPAESGDNASGDELIIIENTTNKNPASNKQARLQETHDFLQTIKNAELEERKGLTELTKIMRNMDTMSASERSAKVNGCIRSFEKAIEQLEPSKILPKLKNCTQEEKDLFHDALQIKITKKERFLEGVRVYASEHKLTPEDYEKATKSMNSSLDMEESESEIWNRVIEACSK